MVLNSISLMAKDAGHVYKYLLAICVSLETSLFSSLAHLLVERMGDGV